MNQIRSIDPKKLINHELLNRLPPLAPDDPSVLKVAQSISDLGRITDPLKITEQGMLVDGRRRRAAALRLKMAEVPCVYVPEGEVPALIVAQLEARSHYTKGQRAYLMAPLVQEAFDYAQQRMLAGVAADPRHSVSRVAKRVEDWAGEMGLSQSLLKQAHELRRYFIDATPRTITDADGNTEEGVSFREFFEPRILREEDPYGLGAALAGIKQILIIEKKKGAGQAHGGGRPGALEQQLKLFNNVLRDQLTRWEYWEKFDDTVRAAHWSAVRSAAQKLPRERTLALAIYHRDLANEFRKAVKAQEEQ